MQFGKDRRKKIRFTPLCCVSVIAPTDDMADDIDAALIADMAMHRKTVEPFRKRVSAKRVLVPFLIAELGCAVQ